MSKIRAGLTCNVVMESKANVAGLSTIYFRLLENRVKRDFPTGIRWPKTYFDQSSQQLLPRFAGDPDVVPFNKKLNDLKSKAHKLMYHEWSRGQALTLPDLVKLFTDRSNTEDFLELMMRKADTFYNDDIIAYGTWKRHRSSLKTFKTFLNVEKFPVGKIDLTLIEQFDAYAKKRLKRKHNTVSGYHKDLKKYLKIAVNMGFIPDNPYKDFSFSYVDGDRQALNQEEIERLIRVFRKPELSENHREVCRQFLFSCFTGLRISDAGRVHSNMINESVLSFVPKKGEGTGKILRLPLQKIALQLIDGRQGLIFHQFSHPYINETLKFLAARADIYKRLTYHCARDTFGTQAVEMGIHIKLISDMMGHSSLKTTSIYLKMSEAERKRAMNKFDERFSL
jgi:integrase/recombinase XerD